MGIIETSAPIRHPAIIVIEAQTSGDRFTASKATFRRSGGTCCSTWTEKYHPPGERFIGVVLGPFKKKHRFPVSGNPSDGFPIVYCMCFLFLFAVYLGGGIMEISSLHTHVTASLLSWHEDWKAN